MKVDRETQMNRMRVGYFEPPENPLRYGTCGAVCRRGKSCKRNALPYWCKRHRFFVRKDGVCPQHSVEPFAREPEQPTLNDDLFSGSQAK